MIVGGVTRSASGGQWTDAAKAAASAAAFACVGASTVIVASTIVPPPGASNVPVTTNATPAGRVGAGAGEAVCGVVGAGLGTGPGQAVRSTVAASVTRTGPIARRTIMARPPV